MFCGVLAGTCITSNIVFILERLAQETYDLVVIHLQAELLWLEAIVSWPIVAQILRALG